jgi:ubiquinone/menaquinone biosynthesis C-methylase UbiE
MSADDQSGQYQKQHRGTQADYEAYFAGMDASMQQKVALTTAHFPVRGRIADMGSGSGRGTYDLARLYDALELVGVDINPISVERAGRQFQRPNLSYVVGDIAEMVFPAASLDGVLNSSVLHHVTSFNGFDVNRVLATLDNQVAQLKTGGVIIIRDFVIPEGPEEVYLDLPRTDGSEAGGTAELSSAALFELFARVWRSSVNPLGPVPFTRGESPRAGCIRYRVTLRAAAEFVLRKDYRADWETEILEEYTYLSQSQFEEAFRSRGLRIITSRPLWNPWIVENRFENKFHLSDLGGGALPFPPTNYLIVGEKVEQGQGVELVESVSRPLAAPKFLGLTASRHKENGRVYELAERPHQTIDILPWFEDDGQLFVFAKKDFPRPIVNAGAEQPRLNRASLSGYITEPISAIVDPSEAFGEAVVRVLAERGGFSREDVLEVGGPFTYYTSPGGINERVMSCLVRVRPRSSPPAAVANYTGFVSAGTVRELDAPQVLRSCHVGGMFDARIEINIYRMLRTVSASAGPWIGAPINLSAQVAELRPHPVELWSPTHPAAAFEPCGAPAAPAFLSLREGRFSERDSGGRVLAEVTFEYVLPRALSLSTVVALPVVKTERGVFIGVEQRDLPAVQSFTGNSKIAAAPAWRLPRAVGHWTELPTFLTVSMRRDFNSRVRRVWELGGPYFPTAGVTPETVYPFVAEVESSKELESHFHFIELNELKNRLDLIQDGHLLITSCRLTHALGQTT